MRLRPALALLLLSAHGATAVAVESGAPIVPGPDVILVERAASVRDPDVIALHELRRASAERPHDALRAAAYARAAIGIGRSRGDPRFYGYARAALTPWLDAPAPPGDVRLLRATLAQHEHRFEAALQDLDPLVAARPSDAQVRLTRALVLMVLGRPRDARADCATLAAVAPRLVAAACVAQVLSLTGDAATAEAGLVRALVFDGGAVDRATRVWATTLAAEIAERRSDVAGARRLFDHALGLLRADPPMDDVALQGARADFLLEQGDAAGAIAALADATAVDALLLKLAKAEQASGMAGFESHRAELAARFALARARGETSHLRDEATFFLDLQGDAAAALPLAEQNWASGQREPADARLLLRTAIAAQRPGRAAPVLDWMRDTGIDDPALAALAAASRAVR